MLEQVHNDVVKEIMQYAINFDNEVIKIEDWLRQFDYIKKVVGLTDVGWQKVGIFELVILQHNATIIVRTDGTVETIIGTKAMIERIDNIKIVRKLLDAVFERLRIRR
ncbi:MAG: hypothetical protein QW622_03470 [Candidatus Pacearchaeota archaeon]